MIYFFFREASDPYAGGPDIMYMSMDRTKAEEQMKAYCKDYDVDYDYYVKQYEENKDPYIWIEEMKLDTIITKW